MFKKIVFCSFFLVCSTTANASSSKGCLRTLIERGTINVEWQGVNPESPVHRGKAHFILSSHGDDGNAKYTGYFSADGSRYEIAIGSISGDVFSFTTKKFARWGKPGEDKKTWLKGSGFCREYSYQAKGQFSYSGEGKPVTYNIVFY